MIKLYTPENELELSFIKSIFDGEDIPYFVLNDHFGSLQIGPHIPQVNMKTIMVPEDVAEQAKELLLDFITKAESGGTEPATEYTLKDKIRVLLEVLIFSWAMPGRRWNRKKLEED